MEKEKMTASYIVLDCLSLDELYIYVANVASSMEFHNWWERRKDIKKIRELGKIITRKQSEILTK